MIYKDLELSHSQTMLLQHLLKNPTSDLKSFTQSDIQLLLELQLIIPNKNKIFFKEPESAPAYYLSPYARMYLLYKRRQLILFIIPTVLSVIALIKSFMP